jgi:hypothetical protein
VSPRIDELPRFFEHLIDVSEDAIKDAFKLTAENITEDMRESGSPSTSPVQWDSEKQRKYVMAKLRKDDNLPYKRTGEYQRSWKKTQLSNGWEVSAKHPAGAIGGTLKGTSSLIAQGGIAMTSWQSKIHRGRWRSFLTTAAQRVSDMPKEIIKRLKMEAGKLG